MLFYTKYAQPKLKSSILVYAVFILIIISLILCSIILISYFNHSLRNKFSIENKLRLNVNSGISLLLADTSVIDYEQQRKISLFNESVDSVTIKKDTWGIFDLLYCKAECKNIKKEKITIAGNFYKTDSTLALYLSDNNKPLCLCGNTIIHGNCKIPKAGIKRGYVEGRHFERDRLLSGKYSFSEKNLPVLKRISEYNSLNKIKSKYLNSPLYVKKNYDEIKDDSITNSFYNQTLVIYEPDNIFLDGIIIHGNIVIIAENEVIISNSCKLKDVIIYGKNIYIENNFIGNIQCFAKDTLIVGENCVFNYPSVLGIIYNIEETISTLWINEGTIVNGIVFFYTNVEMSLNKNEVNIENNVVIKGQVYSSGSLELKGKVFGSITCKEFRLHTPSSIYLNHLLDVEISSEKLSDDFIGFDFLNVGKPGKIIKCLY